MTTTQNPTNRAVRHILPHVVISDGALRHNLTSQKLFNHLRILYFSSLRPDSTRKLKFLQLVTRVQAEGIWCQALPGYDWDGRRAGQASDQ